jgi:hypothetical protein
MEKTNHAITQGRKGRAQLGRPRGWDRAPRKAPAPPGHQQDQVGIKYGFLLNIGLGKQINPVIRRFRGFLSETPD